MTAVLDDLGLTALVTSIPGLSAAGAAGILAETGDPRRFPTARALVKHAGLAPRQKKSGTFAGKSRLTGAGRPRLRLAAWRAAWGARHANPVYQARYQHLTTRADNPLRPPRPRPPSPPRSCGTCTPSSLPGRPGTPPSPPAVPGPAPPPSPPDPPRPPAPGRGKLRRSSRHP
jgi:hypothetical protein